MCLPQVLCLPSPRLPNMMNDQSSRVLKQLIERYGLELVSDPRRTEALLNDLCGQYRREIFVLVNAQRQNVPADLLAAPAWMPRRAVWSRLSRRLHDKLALAEDAADWAVASWADALDLAALPPSVPEPRPAAIPAAEQADNLAAEGRGEAAAMSPPAAQAAALRRPRRRGRPAPASSGDTRNSSRLWLAAAAIALALWISASGAAMLFPPGTIAARLFAGPQQWFIAVRPDPADQIEQIYTLPRMAWVSAGPLLVRGGPSTDHESVAMLQAGEALTVTAFSPDAAWSQTTQPAQGWVSNQFLSFLSPGDVPVSVRIGVQALTVASGPTPVFETPDAAGAVARMLPAGAEVVAVAATADGQWRHILQPLPGWMAATSLEPFSE